jgi:hypothetical protein
MRVICLLSWSGWPDLNRRPLRPEANARCGLPPLLPSLTCLAPSVDVLWHPLVSVAVVTQLVTHPPRSSGATSRAYPKLAWIVRELALSPVAAVSRWLLPLLSSLLSATASRCGKQLPEVPSPQ